ncbi:MAG: hypothetical protein ACYC1Q_01730, partial [Bacteroidia bacterium]
MRRLILILSFLTSYFAVNEVQASHVMGSDIVYKCIGGGQYEVLVRVYRDCNGNNINQANLTATCGANTVIVNTQTLVSVRDITGISPNCNVISACAGGPYAYGVEEYIFSMILDLSPYSCCNWTLSWELCCRNNGISTGMAGENFYTTATLNKCLASCNSSPDFTNPPIAIVCDDQDFIFNNGALDTIDVGDSLSYALVPALRAAGTSVTYSGSYNAQRPLRFLGFPTQSLPWPSGFHLDPATGDLAFRPTQNGQIAVIVMEITEWRMVSGVMTAIGTTRRDMQVIVTNCPGNTIPTISGPFNYEICANQNFCIPITTFDANATDTVQISWNSGISGATFTNNNGTVRLASGSVCWTPTDDKISSLPYTFTITARDNDCPLSGQAIASYSILVRESPHTTIAIQEPVCGNVAFGHISTPATGLTTDWSVYDTLGTLLWSSAQQYDTGSFAAGTYYVELRTGTSTPCDTTIYDTLVVPPYLAVQLPADMVECNGNNVLLEVTTQYGAGTISYNWHTSSVPSSTLSTDSFYLWNVSIDETFVVQVSDSLGCLAYDTINVISSGLPVLNLGPDQVVCTGNSSILDGGASGSSLTYLWSDASTGRWLNVTDSGTYFVQITDSIGCINYDTVEIALNSAEPIITGDDSVCHNKILHYSAVLVPSETYSWNVVGGTIVGSSVLDEVDVLWNGNDSGSISLTQTSAIGCDSTTTLSVIIQRTPAPLIVMANDSVCENKIETYSVAAFSGDSYSWSVNGGSVIGSTSGTSIDVLWGSSGTGTVSVTQTSDWGCDSTVSSNVIIVPTPIPVIVLANDTACENKILSYSIATPSAGHTYAWSVNGGAIIGSASGTSINVLWAGPGTSTITVNQTSGFGCDSAVTENVTVVQTPKPVITFPNDTVCENKIASYSVTPVAGESYAWSVSGGAIIGSATAASIDVLWGAPGTGTVTLTQTSAWGCDSTVSQNILVVFTPTPVITLPNDTACENKIITYTSNILGSANYQWSVSGGTLIGSTTSQSVQVLWGSPGTGILQLTHTNLFNCDSTVQVSIPVVASPAPSIVLPNDTACLNKIASYSITPLVNHSYLWAASGGTIIGSATSTTVQVLWNMPGVRNISVFEYDPIGGCDSMVSATVTVIPTPTPVIVLPNDTACENKILSYSITTPTPGHAYAWSVSGGSIIGSSSGTSIDVLWAGPGTGTVSVNQTSAFGCDSAVSENVLIIQTPKPVIVLANDSTCQNKIATYSITPVAGESYAWSVSGGAILGSASASSI